MIEAWTLHTFFPPNNWSILLHPLSMSLNLIARDVFQYCLLLSLSHAVICFDRITRYFCASINHNRPRQRNWLSYLHSSFQETNNRPLKSTVFVCLNYLVNCCVSSHAIKWSTIDDSHLIVATLFILIWIKCKLVAAYTWRVHFFSGKKIARYFMRPSERTFALALGAPSCVH